MKQGFTLIEFLLAFMFVSVIILTLFNAFFLINRVLGITGRVIEQDSASLVIYNQLSKDISSITIPSIQLKAALKKKSENEKQEKKEPATKTPVKMEAKKPEPEIKPIKKLFVATVKDDMVAELSFISTHHIRVYEQAKNVPAQPRFLRITYRLIENPEKKGTFTLYRKEEEVKEEKKERVTQQSTVASRGFALADNICGFSCSFEYPEFKKEEKKKDIKFQEFKTVKQWQSDELVEKKKQVIVPYAVIVKLKLCATTDPQEEASHTFKFIVSGYDLVVDYLKASLGLEDQEQPEKEPEKKNDKKEEKKPAASDLKSTQSSTQRTVTVYNLPTVEEMRESMSKLLQNLKGS